MNARLIKNGRRLICTLPMLLAVAVAPAQITWYVDDDAPGDPGPGDPNVSAPLEDGSADHPFDAIQEGIDAAEDGDSVLVADGTYTGPGNAEAYFVDKAINLKPRFARAYLSRGTACYNRADHGQGRRDWEQAIRLDHAGKSRRTARENLRLLQRTDE